MSTPKMPGPGFFKSVRLGRQFQRNYLLPMEDLFRDYGNYVQVPAVGHPVLFAFHPDGVEHALKSNAKNYRKPDDLEELKPLLGEGLLTSEGEHWREHRRTIAPEFQHKKVEGFFPIMQKHLSLLIEAWRKQESLFNTAPSITRMTYGIAGECFFGANVEHTSEAVYHAVDQTSEFAVQRMGAPFVLPASWPLPSHLRTRRSIQRLNEIVFGIIDQRQNKPTGAQDVLSRLSRAGTFTREHIRDEVMTLLLAGHETTSNAVSWTLYLLGRHPRIQENLRDEVSAAVSGEVPTTDEIRKLTLTKMVFEESMRLFPPAAIIGRKALSDDQMGGFAVPKGSNVNLAQWITHRHPEFWETPHDFQPERFTKPHHPFAYFPFAAGPRECIGKNMAMVEGIAIVAAIAKNFRFTTAGPEVRPRPLITVRPEPGVHLRLKPVSY